MAANKTRREHASGMDAVDRPEAVRRRLLRNELRPERRYSVAWLLFAEPAPRETKHPRRERLFPFACFCSAPPPLNKEIFPPAKKNPAGKNFPPARRG